MSMFENCQLYISARSPFARRVRLAFLESHIKFEERVHDVFNLPLSYEKINPLMRVPVVILKNGEGIIDSSLILQVFYQEQNQSPLIPKDDRKKAVAARWAGVAVGLCEFAVQHYLESIRTENKSSEVLNELDENIKKSVDAFGEFLGSREFVVDSLTQSDLDMGTFLTYLSIRNKWDWRSAYPNLAKYLDHLEQRDSFKKTKPPL